MQLFAVPQALESLRFGQMDPSAVVVTLLSALVCFALTTLLPKHLSLDYRSRVTSSLHALVVCAGSYYTYYDRVNRVEQHMWAHGDSWVWTNTTAMATLTNSITLGYFIADFSLWVFIDRKLLDTAMIIHHVLALVGFTAGHVTGFANIYQAVILINEGSSIAVNCFFMYTKDRKDILTTLNGLAMWLSFLFFRLIINTGLAISMYRTITKDLLRGPALVMCLFTVFVFLCGQALNIMWFYKMTTGLIKSVAGLNKKGKAPAKAGAASAPAKAAAKPAAGGADRGRDRNPVASPRNTSQTRVTVPAPSVGTKTLPSPTAAPAPAPAAKKAAAPAPAPAPAAKKAAAPAPAPAPAPAAKKGGKAAAAPAPAPAPAADSSDDEDNFVGAAVFVGGKVHAAVKAAQTAAKTSAADKAAAAAAAAAAAERAAKAAKKGGALPVNAAEVPGAAAAFAATAAAAAAPASKKGAAKAAAPAPAAPAGGSSASWWEAEAASAAYPEEQPSGAWTVAGARRRKTGAQ